MKRLVLAEGIYPEIYALSRKFSGEFAVTLFGEIQGEDYVVSHIAPPGQHALSDDAACTGDDDFETAVFHQLRAAHPGIRWLGDLHAHPTGCRWLSLTDRRTIRNILLGTDDTLHPEEYVAGILLRTEEGLDILPLHFHRANLKGSLMEVHHERLCQKSQGTRSLLGQAYRHCRSWLSRQLVRPYRGSSRSRGTHPDRS